MKYYRQEPLRHVGDVPAMGAERYGEKLAFEYRGEEYSYADVEARSNRVANALANAGIDPGDRVALYLENSLQFPETFFGVIKAGAVAVPLNHRMDTGRLKYILADAEAAALVTSPVFPSVGTELAEEVPLAFIPGGAEGLEDYDEHVDSASPEFDRPDREFEDVAVQCYTSGTTGDPKGVLTTHENLLSTVQSYTSRSGSDPEEDVALCFLPLFHMYGLSVVMLTGLYNGATVVLRTMPVASELLSAITEFEVTQFAGIPAVYIEMLSEMEDNPDKYDVSSLETLGSGAAPLADDTRRRIEDAFDTPLTEGWGMTETSPAGTTSSTYGVHKGAGCIGQPLPNVELKLVDPMTRDLRVPSEALDPTSATTLEDHGIDPDDEEQVTGELAIRGPQVFEGYHGLPEKTAAVFDDEGWFYTDDIARVDSDRFLWMVDRADDMLIVGGENV
ncbi:MAG: class I adenylate-forming enzyme family protein, partial [Natronomonas sp.]